MEAKKSKRPAKSRRRIRNYLLQPYLQVRLGVYSVLLAFLFCFSLGFIVFTCLQDFAELILSMTDSESEVRELFFIYVEKMRWWIFSIMAVFLIINVVSAIVFTHKLIGPTVAFRYHIRRLLIGNFSERVQLRKGDSFTELAQDLNTLAEVLQKNQGTIPATRTKESPTVEA